MDWGGRQRNGSPQESSTRIARVLKICQSFQSGFSLVELLVVIAVIAIIAAIAIPGISEITREAMVSKNRRNANVIAHLAASVRSGGYTNAWTDPADAIEDLILGIDVRVGSEDVRISLSDMDPTEISGASSNLVLLPNGTLDVKP